MDKDYRKELKTKSKQRLKKHFKLYVVMCLIASILGVKYASALFIISGYNNTDIDIREEQRITVEFNMTDALSQLILNGNIESGTKEEIEREISSSGQGDKDKKPKVLLGHLELGDSNGVFASIYKSFFSRTFLLTILVGAYKLCESMELAIILAAFLIILVTIVIWMFFTNIFKVFMARFFLEGRLYDNVPLRRFSYLMETKTWISASMTMFVLAIYKMLWNLTIIGGLIKSFSYFAVPYIVSENPKAKVKDAINLSQRLMYGHKKQLLVLMLSFLGWEIINVVTLGLLGLFFLNPYREATYAEFYSKIRQEGLKNGLDQEELLNDKCLFVKAPKTLLQSTYGIYSSEISPGKQDEPGGFKGFLYKYLGISTDENFDDIEKLKQEEIDEKKQDLQKVISAQQYPWFLYPLRVEKKDNEGRTLYPIRRYSVSSLILIFMISSFVGWLWEGCFHLVAYGNFVNRGFLHGPWIPIYGVGGTIILTILFCFRKKPFKEFAAAILLCGVIEYFTGWFLEYMNDGFRWWDYDGYFLNIDGRVCAEGLLIFGLGGMFIVYFFAPLLDNLFRTMNKKMVTIICVVLLLGFGTDLVYSLNNPNSGKGVISDTKRQELLTEKTVDTSATP